MITIKFYENGNYHLNSRNTYKTVDAERIRDDIEGVLTGYADFARIRTLAHSRKNMVRFNHGSTDCVATYTTTEERAALVGLFN